MDKNQFKENLLLHGSDIRSWPEEIIRAALEALENSPDLKALIKEQEHLESFLNTRRYENPSNDFAERIISASLHKKQSSFTLSAFVSALMGEFRFPKPALTTISVLILLLAVGFITGFFIPSEYVSTPNDETSLQAFLYYEEDIPWTRQ